MKTKTKCESCKKKSDVLNLWRNNFAFASGTKWLCNECFDEKVAQDAVHLLRRYQTALADNWQPKTYSIFKKTFDRSSRDERLIFLQLIGKQQNESV